MLNCGEGDRALRLQLEKAAAHTLTLPPGCEITYELEALDMLQRLLRPAARGDAFEAWYLDFKERFGGRPTALDMFHAGFNPRASGHGRWFDFVRDQGDLTADEARVLAAVPDFLNILAITPMTRCYKMLLLQAMRREGALPGQVDVDALTTRFTALAKRDPAYQAEVTASLKNTSTVRKLLEDNPIDAWINGRGTGGRAYFNYAAGVFRTTFQIPGDTQEAFEDMVDEIIVWRLAEYLDRGGVSVADTSLPQVAEGVQAVFVHDEESRAEPWREYMREEIPGLYGLRFNTGSWNAGFVVKGQHAFVLATLDKSNLQVGAQYLDRFPDPEHFSWHSQTKTARVSKHGRIISQTAPGYTIHLFVRGNKMRGTKGAPFVYCGDVYFESWEGDAPISVVFKLREAVPERLRRVFGV